MSGARAVVSFVDLIFHHALLAPAKPAIILPDRVVTYDMMAQGILCAEDRIRSLGLNPGVLVCVSIDSPIRTLIVSAALFRLGHPVIITGKPDDCFVLRLPVGAYLHDSGTPLIPGQRQAVVDESWFIGDRRKVIASPPRGFSDDGKICCVALSSGTTGRPKPISLTIRAFQQWVENDFTLLGFRAWERLLLLVGLTTNWGFTLAAHALFAGRTLVFANNARESLHMITLYNVEAAVATTLQLRDIVREQMREALPCPSLRMIATGGGLFSPSLIAEAQSTLCNVIVTLYGSSEAGGTAIASADKVGSIAGVAGFVAPWAEVEIVDDAGNELPIGSEGIIRIRATCQGAPYPPGVDNPNFRGGWFYPDDLGRFTPDGLLVVTGRKSEVVNVGGLKLAPDVIEDVLRNHPAISDAAAIGSVGEGGIEEVSIAIIAKTPVSDSHLIDWCGERGIPVARIFTVDVLPKTTSGKIQRDLLKRQLLEPDGSA